MLYNFLSTSQMPKNATHPTSTKTLILVPDKHLHPNLKTFDEIVQSQTQRDKIENLHWNARNDYQHRHLKCFNTSASQSQSWIRSPQSHPKIREWMTIIQSKNGCLAIHQRIKGKLTLQQGQLQTTTRGAQGRWSFVKGFLTPLYKA